MSSDGERLFSSARDLSVRVWNMGIWPPQEMTIISDLSGSVYSMLCHPTGRLFCGSQAAAVDYVSVQTVLSMPQTIPMPSMDDLQEENEEDEGEDADEDEVEEVQELGVQPSRSVQPSAVPVLMNRRCTVRDFSVVSFTL